MMSSTADYGNTSRIIEPSGMILPFQSFPGEPEAEKEPFTPFDPKSTVATELFPLSWSSVTVPIPCWSWTTLSLICSSYTEGVALGVFPRLRAGCRIPRTRAETLTA